jgi:hypothetical protein
VLRPADLDHLVYGCHDLERGMDRIEKLLGVRPARGGRHPGYGTHNAVASVASRTYLEVIAPDPSVPTPGRGHPFGLDSLGEPRLATWALRVDAIAAVAGAAWLGRVEAGARRTTDGTLLSWRLTDPYVMPLGGVLPFLIDWGETPHPAEAAPRAGTLLALRIEHPDPQGVRAALASLGVPAAMDVRRAGAAALVARLETGGGVVELR